MANIFTAKRHLREARLTIEKLKAENELLRSKQLPAMVREEIREEIRAEMPKIFREMAQNVQMALFWRSTSRSAAFVEENIPFHLAMPMKNIRVQAIKSAPKDGLFLEFGVWTGDWINFMADFVPGEIYGFDSFEGLPETWAMLPKGMFDLKGKLPEVKANVRLIKGWFQDTLPGFLEEHPGPVSFIHMDCDLYSSTMCVLQHLRDRLVAGTRIVFDDFFVEPGWEQAEFKAFFDFVQRENITFEYTGYCNDSPGVAAGVRLTKVP